MNPRIVQDRTLLMGRRADETLERPAADSALGIGRRAYEWSAEEAERQFAETLVKTREQRS